MNRWRDASLFDLIGSRLAGRCAVKRDFDDKRGQFLLLAAFEREADARELAQSIGAVPATRYEGYASQHGLKCGSKFLKTLADAIKKGKAAKRPEAKAAEKAP